MKRVRLGTVLLALLSVTGRHCVVSFGVGVRVPTRSADMAKLKPIAPGCAGIREQRLGGVVRQITTCKLEGPRTYSSSDWFANMMNLPKSRLLRNIRHHLLANTGFAFFVSLVHYFTPQHIIDDLHVSPIPHTISAGALGLLLVFRTNAAYNRFWEARKVWGGITNTVRNLARVSMVFLGPESAEYREFREYLKVYAFLLKQHLRNERNDMELEFLTLSEEALIDLQEDPNPPLYACQIMSKILSKTCDGEEGTKDGVGGRVSSDPGNFVSVSYRMELERMVSSLIDALGMCERLLTTPVPRGYSRHTSRFLTVYGLTLPLVLVPHTELFTAPVVCAVCWGLFSIEEIAYFIEQPFDEKNGQLNLQGFAEKIRKDIDRMSVKSGIKPSTAVSKASMEASSARNLPAVTAARRAREARATKGIKAQGAGYLGQGQRGMVAGRSIDYLDGLDINGGSV